MKQLSIDELVDELSDAIDDRMDMDVSYSMLAQACVDRLAELGALYPVCPIVVYGFHKIDMFACGLLSAMAACGITYLLLT